MQSFDFFLQGNGYERDFCNFSNVYVMDVYNNRVYPKDHAAKAGIRRRIELHPFTSDYEYLELVEMCVKTQHQLLVQNFYK